MLEWVFEYKTVSYYLQAKCCDDFVLLVSNSNSTSIVISDIET